MPAIEAIDIVKRYGKVEAVKGVSFTVGKGETFGFLGPNGAGKTTTINILCTLLSQDSGVARVSGFDCLKDPHGVRSSIGLVFQEVTLDNELTAEENLNFHSYLYGMDRKSARKRMDELFDVVGLAGRRKDFVRTFSGGMKRRLEVARGLLHKPRVLFLDEPTLGLDPQTRSSVWEFIDRMKKSEGSTVFMTTHYMDEAEACDRIAVIDNGRIIACDSPAGLKHALKGDTVCLKTSDDARAVDGLKEKFGKEAKKTASGLVFTVEDAEKFIPRLFSGLGAEILSVSVKKPTLDEVFLHLTGREIRENGGHGGNGRGR